MRKEGEQYIFNLGGTKKKDHNLYWTQEFSAVIKPFFSIDYTANHKLRPLEQKK